VRVSFVCLGNICRSPTAEGVFRHLVEERGLSDHFIIDSAGTSAVHQGEAPDARSTAVARSQGITLAGRSRRFVNRDYGHFDLVLAMDQSNLAALRRLPGARSFAGELRLFLDFDPDSPAGAEMPDPYYGGPQGFQTVLDLCRRGSEGLLEALGC
jgi:protein-tyrosine phosphatase